MHLKSTSILCSSNLTAVSRFRGEILSMFEKKKKWMTGFFLPSSFSSELSARIIPTSFPPSSPTSGSSLSVAASETNRSLWFSNGCSESAAAPHTSLRYQLRDTQPILKVLLKIEKWKRERLELVLRPHKLTNDISWRRPTASAPTSKLHSSAITYAQLRSPTLN